MNYQKLFLSVVLIFALYYAFKLIQPFILPLIFSVVLATLFGPVHQRVTASIGQRPSLGAFITCTLVLISVIGPLVVFGWILINEGKTIYTKVQTKVEKGQLPNVLQSTPTVESTQQRSRRWREIAERWNIFADKKLQQQIEDWLRRQSHYISDALSAMVVGFGEFFIQFLLMLISLFFFLRDGDRILARSKELLPLSPVYEEMIIDHFRQTTRATFLGTFLTAFSQGLIAGIIYYVLGVPSSAIWGLVTAISSVVPVIGTLVVWGPLAIYLMTTATVWKGVLLIVFSLLFIIGLVDYVLRPVFIQVKGMHDLVVIFSALGGMTVMGISGLVIGPVMFGILISLLEIYKREFAEQLKEKYQPQYPR